MTEKQIEKEVQRQAALSEEKCLKGQVLNENMPFPEGGFDCFVLFGALKQFKFYAGFRRFAFDNLRQLVVVYGAYKQRINNRYGQQTLNKHKRN